MSQRDAIEIRADALDQLLSELQDGNAWDSTISLLTDYADLVREILKDRAETRAELVRGIVANIRGTMCDCSGEFIANEIETKWGNTSA